MDDKAVYFSPIKSKRTFEEISTEIKRLIIEGVFKPGDRLPAEAEIARQFGVGRQTVREALRLLELSGFLVVHCGGGGGSVVTNTILNTLSKSFLDAVLMRNISVAELTLARTQIEKVVAAHAVAHASEEDFAALTGNIKAGMEKIDRGIRAFEENIDFHVLLAKASHNGVFVVVVESIMTIVADFLRRIPQPVAVSKKVLEQHANILAALKDRDNDLVLVHLYKDLRFVDDRLRSSIAKPRNSGENGKV
jgi:DNA-binding FadR family transcriptional regulator